MRKIHFSSSKEYDVIIAPGILKDAGKLIAPECRGTKCAVITGTVSGSLYGEALEDSLKDAGFEVFGKAFTHGEASKNPSALFEILSFLERSALKRSDTLIALGGGVTGDIAGLAAALYMRGIDCVQIPTTLLAAVDSSVGGKTAVNLGGAKNMAGAFYPPSLVLTDTEIISALPDEIFSEGLGEVIKYDVISGTGAMDMISDGTARDRLEDIISSCVECKRTFVEKDEFETLGVRNVLNAGHTAGHAIEALSGYTVPHGKAVANGLLIEAMMAASLGLCPDAAAKKIKDASEKCGLLDWSAWPRQAEDFVSAMKTDKKSESSLIVFEFPSQSGITEKKLSCQQTAELYRSIFK